MKNTMTSVLAIALVTGCQGNVSDEARSTISELRALSAGLETADARGDRALALQGLDPVTAILRRLNDTPGIEGRPLANCRIAAVHLADGLGAVYGGGTWASKSRFQEALAACA